MDVSKAPRNAAPGQASGAKAPGQAAPSPAPGKPASADALGTSAKARDMATARKLDAAGAVAAYPAAKGGGQNLSYEQAMEQIASMADKSYPIGPPTLADEPKPTPPTGEWLAGYAAAKAKFYASPPPEVEDTGPLYHLKEGDTLTDIAKRELGSADKWEQIYEANKELFESLGTDGVIVVGTTIHLEKAKVPTAAQKAATDAQWAAYEKALADPDLNAGATLEASFKYVSPEGGKALTARVAAAEKGGAKGPVAVLAHVNAAMRVEVDADLAKRVAGSEGPRQGFYKGLQDLAAATAATPNIAPHHWEALAKTAADVPAIPAEDLPGALEGLQFVVKMANEENAARQAKAKQP